MLVIIKIRDIFVGKLNTSIMERIRTIKDFFSMYVEGFRNMTWGKTLWVIIILKLFIMFAILKVFFFPNYLGSRFDTEEEKGEYVIEQLTKNHSTNTKNFSDESD
jgi:hypothetical protein